MVGSAHTSIACGEVILRFRTLLFAVPLLAFGGIACAQGVPSVTPTVPGDTVPTWVFYWVLGLTALFAAVLLTIIKILWAETRKKSGLSEGERNKLNQLYDWHDKRDDDQVPLWYTPRSMVSLIKGLQGDHAAVKGLLTRIVEQSDGITADLREQLRERLESHDRQQSKMLKLAVRVQQAIEALAGLAPPSIEPLLDDDGDDPA